jgi:hypothetical protein
LKWIFIVLSIIGIIALFGVFSVQGVIAPVLGEKPVVGQFDAKEGHIEAYLDRLSAMESCGKGIIDTNGLISRGDFCFQDRTFLAEVGKFYPQAEPQELQNLLGDRYAQEQIILAWIEKDPRLLEKHFYTSTVVRKLGLP